MNLIERLGGYDSLKKEYEETLPLIQKGYKSKGMEIIRLLLLEHRRQHNIFEVGDCAVKTNPKIKHAHVRAVISTSPSGGAVLDYQGFPYKFPCVRHATTQEIQAGRRL